MQCLSDSERREAIEIITDLYFDVEVAAAVRNMIRKQRQKAIYWNREFKQAFPDAYADDDTQEYVILEFDGD